MILRLMVQDGGRGKARPNTDPALGGGCRQPHCSKYTYGFWTASLLKRHQKSQKCKEGGPCQELQCMLCRPSTSPSGGAGLALLAEAADTIEGDTHDTGTDSEVAPAAMYCTVAL